MKNKEIIVLVALCVMISLVIGAGIGIDRANIKHESIQDSLLTEIQNLRSQISMLSKQKVNKEQEFKIFAFENYDPKYTYIVNIVLEKSKEHNFSPYKILSIIQIESHFNYQAVSKAGAYGLMQVQFSTWKETFNIDHPRKLFDPAFNINVGIQIYKHYKEKTNGDIEKALHHYNAGYKKIKTDYPSKVMSSKFFK